MLQRSQWIPEEVIGSGRSCNIRPRCDDAVGIRMSPSFVRFLNSVLNCDFYAIFKPWRAIMLAKEQRCRAETGMFVPSIECLVLVVRENGRVILNGNGIWQQRADGDPLLFTDAIGRKFSAP